MFEKFTKEVEQMGNENTFVCGYNLCINPQLDKLDQLHTQQDSRNYRSDNKTFFTLYQGNKRWRLDYIFTTEHLLNFVEECHIFPVIHLNPCLLKLSFKIGHHSDNVMGFWKFNAIALHDVNHVDKVESIVNITSRNYEQWQDNELAWQRIKLEIRTQTIPHFKWKGNGQNIYMS